MNVLNIINFVDFCFCSDNMGGVYRTYKGEKSGAYSSLFGIYQEMRRSLIRNENLKLVLEK